MTPEEKRPLKVFLCHASGDKPGVRDLYKRLTMEGVDAWLDKEKLLPGQDWQIEIPRAVHDADVVVVCLSNKSITKEGYVQKEIKFALDIAEEKPQGAIFLIPARLEDCPVPERLGRWQWVDLYEENGFTQLLRSLKLRASAVGAVIEAVSYEDPDKERERRLNQLYTEGLEAFYTEDWDRACRRFQAILSEQPNHKNAAEKLEEAQCQGHYAKLYAQGMEAYRSENWGGAIPVLEELTQKAPVYKDADQLLKDARKKKQLTDLYAEARTLHAAGKWQAVVKVFEQISILDPNYIDADGLLPSAQKELAEAKRLSDLNDQYSQALREMDAKNWQEACRLLENVHKSQTGFLETEKLLRKVENEILKEEKKRKQNEQINILYEQAHGSLRSKRWRNALEKVEEIRKLDEHFPDPDGITEKARTELEREQQDAERQNQLAAMYAEAVRLLKEEKYQQALDKWQEVKTIDPKYPDRQWVETSAKRKLAETVKPSQIKPRFAMTRSLWIWIGGFVVVAVVITSVILLRQGGQAPLPTLTLAPTGNMVINPSTTNVPYKTNTPRPTTSTPMVSGQADPTMYDDFNNIAFDGTFNDSAWHVANWYVINDSFVNVSQQNGTLKLTVNGYGKGFGVYPTKQFYPNPKPMFIEARVMLDPNTTKAGTDVGVQFESADGYTPCAIFAGSNTQEIDCYSDYFGIKQKDVIVEIKPGSWHVLRIEVYGDTMTFKYFVDGREIGSYVPVDIARMKNLKLATAILLNNWGDTAKSPAGYADYFRAGAIEDDPQH